MAVARNRLEPSWGVCLLIAAMVSSGAGSAVALELAPPVAEAGADQLVAELSEVTLDGTASDPAGQTITYSWQQIQGQPIELSDAETATPSFRVPELIDGDETFAFTLTVSGPGGSDFDSVAVFGIDASRRTTDFTLPAESGVRVLDGGTQALVFEGAVQWGTLLEQGLWTALRVRPSGAGDEASLLGGLSLFLDLNRDGEFDAADDLQLGDTAFLGTDEEDLTFLFSKMLMQVQEERFFLIADLPVSPEGTGGTNEASLLWPALLLGALGVFGLAGNRRLRSGVARVAVLLILAGLPLGTLACRGGGGGSRPPASPPSTEVRFELLELIIHGDETMVPGTTNGLPAEGPPLVL